MVVQTTYNVERIRGATRHKVARNSCSNLLFLILRGFIKLAITVQATDKNESVRGDTSH